jgi:hypothetical protein
MSARPLIALVSFFAASSALIAETKAPALPREGLYSQYAYSEFAIEKADKTGLKFSADSTNPYRATTCGLQGFAAAAGEGKWIYNDAAIKACSLTVVWEKGVELKVETTNGCAAKCGLGAVPPGGLFRMIPDDCAERSARIDELTRAKSLKEARELGLAVTRECLLGFDDNTRGSIFLRLAELSRKLDDKPECRNFASTGFAELKVPEGGLKQLQEHFEFYGGKDQPDCEGVWNGGCLLYKERIRLFRELEKIQALCAEKT